MKILLLFYIFFFITVALANDSILSTVKPSEVGLSQNRLERIDKVFKKSITKKEIPGAVIAISRYGKIAYLKAFGLQNPSNKTPMTINSIFRIYSMTKPIVSVAAMNMTENGTIYLNENIDKYIPSFSDMKVATASKLKDGNVDISYIKVKNKIKIQDLLRHTSGLTYGVFGKSPAKQLLKNSTIGNLNIRNISLEEYVNKLAKLPLAYNPGTTWEYGRSIEVLGRVLEVASNSSLDILLKEKLFTPLNMKDTAFYVDKKNFYRIAEPFKEKQPELINIKKKPLFLTGGHGLVSTVSDYMRFCQMMLNKGKVGNKIIVSKNIVEYMTSNHLGKNINRNTPYYLPGQGYGFGLGFAVRENSGISPWPGSKGEYFWAGYAGTYFWIDPKEELIVVSMTQSVTNRNHFRMLLRNLVYQAIIN